MSMHRITQSIEYFKTKEMLFDEVTLIDANDSFTHNLVESFLKLGAPVRVYRGHDISLEDIVLGSYLVLSPGPGVPDKAGVHKSIIKQIIGSVPILGVCLGMQAINEVFLGKTILANYPVHGKVSEIEHDGTGIFKGIESPTPVARYHSLVVSGVSDTFSVQSEYKGEIMAFHNDDKNIHAVQFHPESFMTRDGMKMLKNFLEMK